MKNLIYSLINLVLPLKWVIQTKSLVNLKKFKMIKKLNGKDGKKYINLKLQNNHSLIT